MHESTCRGAPASPLEKPQSRQRDRHRRGHEEEHVGLAEQEHVVDHVVVVQAGRTESKPEPNSQDNSEPIHRAPPVTKWTTKVTATAVAKKVAAAAKLAGDRDGIPASPCPDVQPSAHRVPKPINAPPTNRIGMSAPIGTSRPRAP